jgi:hypothetical protein
MSTLRAKESFTAFVGKGDSVQALNVAAGELLDSGHAVVKGREKLFESVEDYVVDPGRKQTSVTRGKEKPSHVLMERATSEPGERRSADVKSGLAKDDDKDADAKRVAERRSAAAKSTPAKGKQDGEV